MRIPDRSIQAVKAVRRLLRRFRNDGDASVAIEFAFIALPFLALVLAIFQTSMVHVTSMTLQSAVTDAARLIRTGQAKTMGQAAFTDAICKNVTATFDCKTMIKVDVKAYNSFSTATAPPIPVKDGVIDTSTFGTSFDTGGAGKIIVVQAAIAYPIVVPLLGNSMVNLNGKKLLIMASAAFKNEAF